MSAPVRYAETEPPRPRSIESARLIHVSLIDPNPYQPRHPLSNDDVSELTASIRFNGVLEPLIVCPCANRFQLIAGYRRLAASINAGLSEVPCILRQCSQTELLELALVENIQRSDLTYLEEAESYQRLMEIAEMDQDMVARRVNKSRATISERLALLSLPEDVKDLVASRKISLRAALELGKITDSQRRASLLSKAQTLSVEQLKELVNNILNKSRKHRKKYEKHQVNTSFKDLFEGMPVKRFYKDQITFIFKEEKEFIDSLRIIIQRWDSEN